MITNSLEWNNLEDSLRRQAKGLTHGREICKMIDNIRVEVTRLSIAEIDARRGKKLAAKEILRKINDDIELVEGYLLIAALIG